MNILCYTHTLAHINTHSHTIQDIIQCTKLYNKHTTKNHNWHTKREQQQKYQKKSANLIKLALRVRQADTFGE